MSFRRLMFAVTARIEHPGSRAVFASAAAALLLTAAVHADSARADECVFEKYAVSSVMPFSTDENYTYGPFSILRGAQLYVQAREGLTAEWLHLSVERALVDPEAASCRPPLRDVHVLVSSAGPGFWVRLGVDNQLDAQKLLSWAQAMAPPAHGAD